MKLNKKLTAGTFLLVPAVVYATVTTFSNLEVSENTSQPNTIYAGSASTGYNNQSSYHSLVLGAHSLAHNSSLSVGHTNESKNLSAAVGYLNNVNKDDNSGTIARSMAVGTTNYILSSDSFASGWNNDVTANQAMALGYALVNAETRSTVVGEYNAAKNDVRFVVGNGDSGSRSNALEVYKNGDVIINKEQGDISMGAFGN